MLLRSAGIPANWRGSFTRLFGYKGLIMTRSFFRNSLALVAVGVSLLAFGRSDQRTASANMPIDAEVTAPAAGATHLARYGVGIGQDADPAQVRALGLEWYFGGVPSEQALRARPAGATPTFLLPINPIMDEAALRKAVRSAPGTAWLIGNEPNVQAEVAISSIAAGTPDQYVTALEYYARVIRSEDATAKLVGPNVLNWSYTCDNCGGFRPGREWTDAMRDSYRARFNQEPPLDIWSVHPYDLDWVHLPNGNAALQIAQIQGLRDWLDAIPALQGAPVWVTEIGFHWAYPGIEKRPDGLYYPVGAFDYDHAEQWMRTVFGWLDANAESQHIEKWFLWLTYTNVLEDWMGEWPSPRLLDGPSVSAPINRLGRLYQQLAGAP